MKSLFLTVILSVIPAVILVMPLASLAAEDAKPGSVLGTVAVLKPETSEMAIKSDNGTPVMVKMDAHTITQKVAPGEADLKNARAIPPAEIALRDRVLVTLAPGTSVARRVVVMAASEISWKNDSDRQDWVRNGLAGVVTANRGNQLVLKMRTVQGEVETTLMISDQTTFKRYAPDSVQFADAVNSAAAEVKPGDQVRARGKKSEDGLTLQAQDVVFGTFLAKVCTVVSVNPEAKEVTVKDLSTGKHLVIKFTADSRMKRMPDLPAAAVAKVNAKPAAAAPAKPKPAIDIAQLLEMLPAAKLENLRPQESVIVTSTKGTNPGQITAIVFLANADALLQLAAAANTRSALTTFSSGVPGAGGGLELPSILP